MGSASLSAWLEQRGSERRELIRAFRNFNAYAGCPPARISASCPVRSTRCFRLGRVGRMCWRSTPPRPRAPPGTVRRFDVADGPLPARMSSLSSHGFGLAEAVEIGRALGRLPERLRLLAVEGASFAPGERLTPGVEEAVERVVAEVLDELGRSRPPSGSQEG